MSIVAVGLAGSSLLLVAAAVLMVAALLMIAARRRLDPRDAPAAVTEGRPGGITAATRLAVMLAHRSATLMAERDEAHRRLAELRMAHRAQRARLEQAWALVGAAISEERRGTDGPEADARRLRAALSAAESHLLAARAAGRAGPLPPSAVPSDADAVGGGPATITHRAERIMALPPDHTPPDHRPHARSADG